MTQVELANRLGLTGRAVADWESGKTRPLASSWKRIADTLGPELLPCEAEIGSRLRAARWRHGLTQEDLAARAGVDVRTVRNAERAIYRPSRRTTLLLQWVLGDDF
jgi:transcriptional regulator with XRE-family HTH domain